MPNDSAEFLLRPGKKTGHIFKSNQRYVESVTEAHEARPLYRSADIQHAGQKRRLIGNEARRTPVQPGKTYDDILGKMLVNLKKITIVHDCVNGVFNVVRLLCIFGDQSVQRLVATGGAIESGAARGVLEI